MKGWQNMADKRSQVYGVVIGCGSDGTLHVSLESGETGIVQFSEISRQTNIRRDNLERMIGWRLGFIPGSVREDGIVELSGRELEEQEYERVISDFHSRKRNIYAARLVSVTADGKLAFYRLAQGVNGALHVSQFCLCRIFSFKDIDLPRQMTVAVSGIDERGWISLSAKPAFGNFEHSVEKLALTEGGTAEGQVTSVMADGAVAVMLAPNLTVLTDASCHVYPGDRVSVKCRRIDWEQHRVKAQLMERLASGGRFSYDEWIRPDGELEPYIDLEEFDSQIRLNKPAAAQETAPAAEQPEEPVDFTVTATRSPFSTYQNERIIREARRPSRVHDIYFETRMGYLNERHLKVASAVEELKYCSAWQVRRYLFLKEKLSFPEREIKSIVDRLVKHDIIGVLRFQSDEGSLLARVLHPANNYRAFCGVSPRNFGPRDFMESDVSSVKTRLASNQLLIGLMNGAGSVESLDTHPFLRDDEIGVRVRPRHTIVLDGKKRYLEAVRKGWEENIIEKLRRYEALSEREKDYDSGVMVVLEEEAQAASIAEKVAELKLPFAVWLTDDLSCLPEPKLTYIRPTEKSLLKRLIHKIEG